MSTDKSQARNTISILQLYWRSLQVTIISAGRRSDRVFLFGYFMLNVVIALIWTQVATKIVQSSKEVRYNIEAWVARNYRIILCWKR